MHVLVTGGLGFIGQHVTRALLARGDRVTILDARTAPVHDPASPRPVPDGATMIEGDITDAAAVDRALDGATGVVHLAAYQDYLPDFSRFFHVNTAGTALLIERIVARALPVRRIVVASSQSVYGEGAVLCERDGLSLAAPRQIEHLERGDFEARCARCGAVALPAPTPEELVAPTNAYGISKLAAEQIVLRLGERHGIDAVAMRYAIVHGAGQSPRNAYSGVLRAACVRALAGEPPIVFEDGASLRDYVAIDDAVSATLIALDHPSATGHAYNCGGPRSWTVLELLEAVAEATGLDLTPEIPGLFRVGDVRHTIGDLTRLCALGWEPATDLADTWRDYVDWLKQTDVSGDVVADAIADMRARGVLRDATGT